MCWECLSQEDVCNHVCCLKWFTEVGKKLGVLQTSLTSSIVNDVKLASPVEAEASKSTKPAATGKSSENIDNILSVSSLASQGFNEKTSQITKLHKASTASREQKQSASSLISKLQAAHSATKKQQAKKQTVKKSVPQIKKRLLTRKTLSKRRQPIKHTNTDILELIDTIEKPHFLHSYPELKCGLESLHAAAMIAITEEWKRLTKENIEHLYNNLQYVVNVVGQHAPTTIQQELRVSPGHIFFQKQGETNYCGVCALNNACQTPMFSPIQMDSFADHLWMRHATELCIPVIEPYPAMRGHTGDYSVEVLLHAVQSQGDNLIWKSLEIHKIFQTTLGSSNVRQGIVETINTSGKYPSSFIMRTSNYHYVTILCQSQRSVWLLDSMKSRPQLLVPTEFKSYLSKNHNIPYFAIFLLDRCPRMQEFSTQPISPGKPERAIEKMLVLQGRSTSVKSTKPVLLHKLLTTSNTSDSTHAHLNPVKPVQPIPEGTCIANNYTLQV